MINDYWIVGKVIQSWISLLTEFGISGYLQTLCSFGEYFQLLITSIKIHQILKRIHSLKLAHYQLFVCDVYFYYLLGSFMLDSVEVNFCRKTVKVDFTNNLAWMSIKKEKIITTNKKLRMYWFQNMYQFLRLMIFYRSYEKLKILIILAENPSNLIVRKWYYGIELDL